MATLTKKWSLKKTILRQIAKSSNKNNETASCKHIVKKSVRFEEQPQVYFVEAMSCLSKTEILATWFTTDELVAMKKEIHSISRQIRSSSSSSKGITKSTNLHYTRGLEGRIYNAANRKAQKEKAINVVLEEQNYQKSLGIQDSEKLAFVFCQITSECQEKAYKAGHKDMLAAMGDSDGFVLENDGSDDLSSTAASSIDWSLSDCDGDGDDDGSVSTVSTSVTGQHNPLNVPS